MVEQSVVLHHVSILGTGDNTVDRYSFSTTEDNSRVILDIDSNTFPTALTLLNPDGSVLQDRRSTGSPAGIDPSNNGAGAAYIDVIIPTKGTYSVRVGRHDSVANTINR